MKLAELYKVQAEVRQAIALDKQHDGTVVRIVGAEVFGNKGEYSLVIKKAAVDDLTFSKLKAIADKHNLLIINADDYLVFAKVIN